MATVSVKLRAITEADIDVLCAIYGSTRTEELAQVTYWTAADKQAFIRQQFDAQHEYYQKVYKNADFQLIEFDGKPIGRLYVQWDFKPEEVRIIDIALLPPFRGKYIGTAILQDIFTKASAAGKFVTIHVEYNNPAMRLYQRLGFQKIGEFNSVYFLMKWTANGDQVT